MASDPSTRERQSAGQFVAEQDDDERGLAAGESDRFDELRATVRSALGPLASMKFTVVLFAMAIFIVLAGTLGQTDRNINDAIDHYFRMPRHVESYTNSPWGIFDATFARIQYKVFFPESFFPNLPKYAWLENHFYFPKGWTIGALMLLNLLAAHLVRFRIQARGARLATGCAILALGALTTYAVIHSGAIGDEASVQDDAALSWETIWRLVQVSLAVLWFAIGALAFTMDASRHKLRLAIGIGDAVFGVALLWLFIFGADWAPDPASMRILWQLIKATSAGVVLLAGCHLVFKQRAGIVLLHAGVGLLMLSELQVGMTAVESHLTAQEGQAKNYSEDTGEYEVAIVDTSGKDADEMTVIPWHMLEGGETVSDDALPFDVTVVDFFPNVRDLRVARPGDVNPATAGIGLKGVPVPEPPSVATDSSQAVDAPAAYVRLTGKDGKPIGVYLLAAFRVQHWVEARQEPEKVQVGGKSYDVSLRYRRIYRPFWVEVVETKQEFYPGTAMPRSYSSDVLVLDEDGTQILDKHIKMNNPLRYAGETYYQSGFYPKELVGVDTTTLQVVTNKGWMIPYVSCMIVAVGMLYQFSVALIRFVRRRSRMASGGDAAVLDADAGSDKADTAVAAGSRRKSRRRHDAGVGEVWWMKPAVAFPAAVAAIGAAWILYAAQKPVPRYDGMNIEAAGELPVMYEGRCKPLDTVARTILRLLSKKETFVDAQDNQQPAIRWLLDVISGSPDAEQHRVFKIENFDVQDLLGVEPRAGYLYSHEEISKGARKLYEAAVAADATARADASKLTLRDRKILEFHRRYNLFLGVTFAFRSQHGVPPIPAAGAKAEQAQAQFQAAAGDITSEYRYQRGSMAEAPLVVPTTSFAGEAEWVTLVGSQVDEIIRRYFPPSEAAEFQATQISDARRYWSDLLADYAAKNDSAFNDTVARYRGYLADQPPAEYRAGRVDYESYFNCFAPFYIASILYLFVFLLSVFAWLGWSVPLNRAAFWLGVLTLVLHTFAIAARIYISGRPPVTTLYTSAVFIGWGSVVMGLAMEAIFRLGLGNVVVGVTGSATLLIAHFLAMDLSGDTFQVLQPVLDTQFWLATHVVCVTSGYAATFLAGTLGLLYVIRGVCTPTLDAPMGKALARMTYGALCFAIFFSFVGTVLGGLWADDSWGRFWGWDVKENGALIIVLWNALVLHARWEGWIKDRGMAVLAMVGNVVTAWSWFGVNNLGIGLHSYGKSEAAITSLLVFWVVQLVLVGVGLLPKSCWWSFRGEKNGGPQVGAAKGDA
ncbi:MAG: cytochrome c biogenesis protein CcsA [Pirellulales bacterium]